MLKNRKSKAIKEGVSSKKKQVNAKPLAVSKLKESAKRRSLKENNDKEVLKKKPKKPLKEEYAETENEAYDLLYKIEKHLIEMGYKVKDTEVSEEEQDGHIDYYGYIALDKDISGDEEFKKIEDEVYDKFGVADPYYQDSVIQFFLGGREVDEVEESCKSKSKTKKKPMKEGYYEGYSQAEDVIYDADVHNVHIDRVLENDEAYVVTLGCEYDNEEEKEEILSDCVNKIEAYYQKNKSDYPLIDGLVVDDFETIVFYVKDEEELSENKNRKINKIKESKKPKTKRKPMKEGNSKKVGFRKFKSSIINEAELSELKSAVENREEFVDEKVQGTSVGEDYIISVLGKTAIIFTGSNIPYIIERDDVDEETMELINNLYDVLEITFDSEVDDVEVIDGDDTSDDLEIGEKSLKEDVYDVEHFVEFPKDLGEDEEYARAVMLAGMADISDFCYTLGDVYIVDLKEEFTNKEDPYNNPSKCEVTFDGDDVNKENLEKIVDFISSETAFEMASVKGEDKITFEYDPRYV